MKPDDIMRDARVAHVRALEAEVARLKAELAEASAGFAAARAHVAEGALALRDAAALPPGGRILLLDGYNILFNIHGRYPGHDADMAQRAALAADVRGLLARQPGTFAWLVFDGPTAAGKSEGALRISYTGGRSGQRADRLILDYLRACRLGGVNAPVRLVTNDVSFARRAREAGADVTGVDEFEKELT